jgi:hypothetical protein
VNQVKDERIAHLIEQAHPRTDHDGADTQAEHIQQAVLQPEKYQARTAGNLDYTSGILIEMGELLHQVTGDELSRMPFELFEGGGDHIFRAFIEEIGHGYV